ncbi:SMP-30/gluconolactonase/LRE family protein [Hymenobacter psoromatis]|uniref:SMP-30/gluconolactonase/LRE family protein n=1 Tax=Hymenobacter psoromatis TaxID=1484116 RepID=UPI001CBD6423|nr:SMP-30/gluconolactonase/LRE family protein [Hymenobacter psoromatis]
MLLSYSRLTCLGLLGGGLLLAACDKDSDTTPTTVLPAAVTFTKPGLYPEGMQYDDDRHHFLVSSQTAGAVGQVNDSAQYKVFADDPQLISSIGLHLDVAGGRLLVAVSDPGYNATRTSAATKGKLAAVAIFNRVTGTKTGYVDLGGLRPNYPAHFANDIAVDGDGNAYVTDSYAPIIYKIDTKGVASVFLEDPSLQAPAGMFGLNGIVYNPNGYLLVAKSDVGALIKVPLDSPSKFAQVKLLATGTMALNLSGDDGLQLLDNATLLAACNAQGQVYRLASTDNFVTVSGTGSFATGAVYPTTLGRRAGQASYVLYSHLDSLQAMLTPPVKQFQLTKVAF